jgi:hypothetical protein
MLPANPSILTVLGGYVTQARSVIVLGNDAAVIGFLFYFVLVGLGFELRESHLQSKCSMMLELL